MTAEELSRSFGYLNEPEVHAVKALVALLPQDARIVNIGAGTGTSSRAIVEVRPGAERYTVDICEGSPVGGLQNERNAYAGSQYALPTQILGHSHDVARAWRYGPVDMAFIDGDHSRDVIAGDIRCWLPLVKPGGIIAFHDYCAETWPDQTEVIDLLLSGYRCILRVDTVIAFWNEVEA